MRKKIMVATLFVAFAVITGMNVYNAQQPDVELSGLALENAEALASGEIFDGHTCDPSWNQECCVCGYKHYTYARPQQASGCEYRKGCSHYNKN